MPHIRGPAFRSPCQTFSSRQCSHKCTLLFSRGSKVKIQGKPISIIDDSIRGASGGAVDSLYSKGRVF